MSVSINGTTGISGVNGSAATPAIQGGDADTGIFFGTNTASISTGGTSRIHVDANGNCGVGVTSLSSSSRLTLLESAGNAQTLEIKGANSGGAGSQPGIKFTASNGDNIGGIYGDTNSDVVRIQTGGSDRLVLDAASANPAATFSSQVIANVNNASGDDSALKAVQTNVNGYCIWAGSGPTAANRTFTVLPSGDVTCSGSLKIGGTADANQIDEYEIGTWTPSVKSQVGQTVTGGMTTAGTYVRVGDLLYLSATVAITGSGNAYNDGSLTWSSGPTASSILLVGNVPFAMSESFAEIFTFGTGINASSRRPMFGSQVITGARQSGSTTLTFFHVAGSNTETGASMFVTLSDWIGNKFNFACCLKLPA
jgi:hypothetical protein